MHTRAYGTQTLHDTTQRNSRHMLAMSKHLSQVFLVPRLQAAEEQGVPQPSSQVPGGAHHIHAGQVWQGKDTSSYGRIACCHVGKAQDGDIMGL
jgi:hypothetical protein